MPAIEVADLHKRRFRPTGEAPDRLLAELATLPGVTDVRRTGAQIMVTGTGDLLSTLVASLAAAKIAPTELRMEQRTLDEAFLALTGRRIDQPEEAS